MSVDVGLALGSNIGDKAGHVRRAFDLLKESGAFTQLVLSPLYRTPPWGKTDQDWFVNACAAGSSSWPAEDVLTLALDIEARMGRVRTERWGPRVIDVDLLYHGNERIETERLHLPHPRMAERGFVMIPLAAIRPDYSIAGRQAADIARDFAGEGIVPLD